jgi:hypothetical protein
MANNWGISREVALLVEARDTKCVYCQSDFFIAHQVGVRPVFYNHKQTK